LFNLSYWPTFSLQHAAVYNAAQCDIFSRLSVEKTVAYFLFLKTFKGKIEIVSGHKFLRRKFAVCRKINCNFLSRLFLTMQQRRW